jgi:hypothetical protein
MVAMQKSSAGISAMFLAGVGVQEVVMLKPKVAELLRLLVLVLAAEGRSGLNLQDVNDVIKQQVGPWHMFHGG